MALTNAEHQAKHRAKLRDQLAARTAALVTIITALDGNDKPMAVKVRQIAQDALV